MEKELCILMMKINMTVNLKFDKKEGKEIMYFNDEDKYDGDYKNDNRDGKGAYYWNNGDFKNGKSDGKGTYFWNDGDRYEGD